jgi:hypothetical protein
MDIKNTKNGVRTQKILTKQGVGAFLQENWAYRGLTARTQGLKQIYAYKHGVYSAKLQGLDFRHKNLTDQGLEP